MVEVIPVERIADSGFGGQSHPALPPFDPAQASRSGCDAHVVARRDGCIVARASVWRRHAPSLPGERCGAIGHFASLDSEASHEVLAATCAALRGRGCTRAIGPMDGTTWRRYRFITERGSMPPFFLEPDNADAWPTDWRAAGFDSLATYFSAAGHDLQQDDPQVTRAGERLKKAGLVLRALDAAHYQQELKGIYNVSVASFTRNFLYTPISEAEFVHQYVAVQSWVRPELVFIVEQDGKPAGFLFAIPDWNEGAAPETVIIKTVAVLPERRFAGLGVWLVQEAQQRAHALGYRRTIHALMHESNNSLNLSSRYATPFRRYTLFSKPL